MNFKFKDNYNIDDLLYIVKLLRSEDGCPWDRVQTHESLKTNLLEETYEVFEAIDDKNTDLLKEELGDVLLQVVMHSQLENEIGKFNFSDVCNDICKKLIERHPHVFSDAGAGSPDEVLKNWEKIKVASKKQSISDALQNITKTLPSLLRGAKLHSKTKKLGVYTTSDEYLTGEICSLASSLSLCEDISEKQAIMAKLLFKTAGLSAYWKLDPELILQQECDNFVDELITNDEKLKNEGCDKQ